MQTQSFPVGRQTGAPPTALDLFAGAGGLSEGLRQAGLSVVIANEADPRAAATYALNHPETRLVVGDIALASTKDKLCEALAGGCDIVAGGVPCQPWSRAGNRHAFGDGRGRLWFDYLEIVGRLRPAVVIAENVVGLLDHPDAFLTIRSTLEGYGYRVESKVLDAVDFGVSQTRRRLFIVAIRQHDRPFVWPRPVVSAPRVLQDIIAGMPEPVPAMMPGNRANLESALPVTNHEMFVGPYSSRYLSRNRVRGWDEPGFTILAGGRYATQHPSVRMLRVRPDLFRFVGRPRRLSVRECARIQGFPDDYKFVYQLVDDGYRQVGNAVPVPVARAVGEAVRVCLSR